MSLTLVAIRKIITRIRQRANLPTLNPGTGTKPPIRIQISVVK